eukprot:scaffold2479_cov146-Isochrysis_galbana.AAC.1
MLLHLPTSPRVTHPRECTLKRQRAGRSMTAMSTYVCASYCCGACVLGATMSTCHAAFAVRCGSDVWRAQAQGVKCARGQSQNYEQCAPYELLGGWLAVVAPAAVA